MNGSDGTRRWGGNRPSLDLSASLTDQAVDLFDRLVGAIPCSAKPRGGMPRTPSKRIARAINREECASTRVGATLIAARDDKQDAYNAIVALMPWEEVPHDCRRSLAVLARPEEFDTAEDLVQHYVGIRRWSPAFLAAFEFESVPAAASLIRAESRCCT